VSDILNFISRDSSVSMTFELYEAMLYRAKEAERKRIIKLLEEYKCPCYCEVHIVLDPVIALIAANYGEFATVGILGTETVESSTGENK
jgi:hypothetical protein